ncbi:MAG: hypothetical protein R3246_04160 [Acidimicrobiia bacterium]|nr:hypothetical protein [Acidimicrobiia bacterium]
MTEEQEPQEETPIADDAPPKPSKWRKRMGMAGLASLGGAVAWLFGRRNKPEA